MPEAAKTGDMYKHVGETRTDLYCHDCSKNFVALLDFDINGPHRIQCPHCSHIHFRVITDGRVTADRWDSDNGRDMDKSYPALRVWKHDVLVAQTSSASHFIRERWLEKIR